MKKRRRDEEGGSEEWRGVSEEEEYNASAKSPSPPCVDSAGESTGEEVGGVGECPPSSGQTPSVGSEPSSVQVQPAAKQMDAAVASDSDDANGESSGKEEDVDEGSKYSEDGFGLRVEHISVDECAFLYQEIFVRRAYTKHATLQAGAGDILDVGANIGLFALFCRQQIPGGSDKIYAFEPVDKIYDVLARNLSSVDGACVCRYGLGTFDSASEKFVYYPETPGESSRQLAESAAMRNIMGSGGGNQGQECYGEVRRLSGVLRENRISRVQLLKVDVEGDELLVLMGIENEDWPIFQQVVMEVHDIEHRLARVTALLQRRGFTVTVEQQTSEWDEDGALLLVPVELRLFYVHAVRGCQQRPEPMRCPTGESRKVPLA